MFGKLGDRSAEEAHYRNAVRLNPEYAAAWANLGWVLSRMKRWEEARDVLRHACTFSDASPTARYCLGIAEDNNGDDEAAFAAYGGAGSAYQGLPQRTESTRGRCSMKPIRDRVSAFLRLSRKAQDRRAHR